ncbi:hypothetical protein PFISCL1PPCAC_8618, partial [Pristionchus fissidentatus]
LKEKSPALYEKVEKILSLLRFKIDALGEEARRFAKERIGEVSVWRAAVFSGNKPTLDELKDKVLSLVEKYKAL